MHVYIVSGGMVYLASSSDTINMDLYEENGEWDITNSSQYGEILEISASPEDIYPVVGLEVHPSNYIHIWILKILLS